MSTQQIIDGWNDGVEPYDLDTVEQHGAAESFSEWLDQRKDSIVPDSFEDWIKSNEDGVIQ